MVFGCGQSLHSAALYLLQSFANTHASTSSASKHKALQHLPQLHIVTATCRPASHLFFGSPPLRYGYIILMTSMQQRIGGGVPLPFSRGSCGLFCAAVWLAWRCGGGRSAFLLFVRRSSSLRSSRLPCQWLQCITQLFVIATMDINTDQRHHQNKTSSAEY
jgi:hypothetical protein